MKIIFFFFMVIAFFPPLKAIVNPTDSAALDLYNKGLSAAALKDYNLAEEYFEKSISQEENAASEYELAKICHSDSSYFSWREARSHIKNAIEIDPLRPEYHLLYAVISEDLFNNYRMEFLSLQTAIEEYNKTIELDSTNFTAAERLGNIETRYFLEYNIAKENVGIKGNITADALYRYGKNNIKAEYDANTMFADRSGRAVESFINAEKCFRLALKYDSLNPKPYISITRLYEEKKDRKKALPYLSRLCRILPGDKDAHLYFGLLQYFSSNLEEAYNEYKTALSLMGENEKKDLTYNSVKVLLEDYIEKHPGGLTEDNLSNIIDIDWRERDPLNITPYNERLLEHYSRVIYANLYYGPNDQSVAGWKTDRGTVLIRYGRPSQRVRLIAGTSMTGSMTLEGTDKKTEIWYYPDKTFAFTDDYTSGNYQFSTPGNLSQYWDDVSELVSELKRTQPEEYHSEELIKFFRAAYNWWQLKDFDNPSKTDIYLGYGIDAGENASNNWNFGYRHTTGIFLFDKYYNEVINKKFSADLLYAGNKIKLAEAGYLFVNTENISTMCDSGSLAFELLKEDNKEYARSKDIFSRKNFSGSTFNISDIILASDIRRNDPVEGRINRKNISILPNPSGIFSNKQDMYIYYEVYNLTFNKDNRADFEQTYILQKSEDTPEGIGRTISSALKSLGISKGEGKIGLTTRYQVKEKDNQVFFQVDMSSYEPGTYKLIINVKDNTSGEQASSSINFVWR